ELSHLPIIADPSHGTGKMKLVEPVGLGMVAAGADGLILEVHPHPERALCDGAQSLTFDAFASVMRNVAAVAKAVGKRMEREAVAV
ncbi:MAG TPA: 3-deoxy-7-phosphoheptulonate synthase, partial [Dehalococcoidia bacterium]